MDANETTETQISLQSRLGDIPMTFSEMSDEWSSAVHRFEVNGAEWSVSFSLSEGRVELYVFNSSDENLFSRTPFAPGLTVEAALKCTLGIR